MCKQLSYEERVRIAELCQAEYSRSEMARALKRSPATIGRELARNGVQAAYSAEVAQGLAERRKSERPIVRKMDRQEIRDAAENGLIQCWSPDQIAARQELLFPKEPKQQVSGSTILRWIQRQPGPLRRHWSKFLRRRGRAPFRPRKPPVEPAKRIRNRPAIIERRGRVGDFEGDLVLGAPGTGGVLTVVCRRSRYLKVVKVQNKLSKHVLKKFRSVLAQLPVDRRRSSTFDNGGEFAQIHRVENTHGVHIYFAEPGCPYQRGTNENTNGLLRQFFPKGTDFRTISHAELRRAENLMNNRPRRCLGYRTPAEVFFDLPLNSICN